MSTRHRVGVSVVLFACDTVLFQFYTGTRIFLLPEPYVITIAQMYQQLTNSRPISPLRNHQPHLL